MTMPQADTTAGLGLLVTRPREPVLRRADTDLRAGDIDPLRITPEMQIGLWGRACARCGSPDKPLSPGGYAYTRARGGGRLGWLVELCARCLPTADFRCPW
ncbi:hypothetical protein ACFYOY_35605 [Streptomyces sp. NPDC007875]|uniref:hypothetical protein n=1 Tax=Streptomyces sp. NPDC007875 TaxID=3364783 RepID=UPI0036C7BF35